MKTIDVGQELLYIFFLILGIGSGFVGYIGHKRKWSLFYDHETEEWVFARKKSFAYQMQGDPEKFVYPTIVVGIIFFSILLTIHVARLVLCIFS